MSRVLVVDDSEVIGSLLEAGGYTSLEKSWHGLHFTLTGEEWGEDGPLAFLLAGPPYHYQVAVVGVDDLLVEDVAAEPEVLLGVRVLGELRCGEMPQQALDDQGP